MKQEIIIVSEIETNPCADDRFCHNGGGYHQPKIVFSYNGSEGEIMDTSCGEFGCRYHMSYSGKDYDYNTIDDYDDYPDSSSFTEEDEEFVNAFNEFFDGRYSIRYKLHKVKLAEAAYLASGVYRLRTKDGEQSIEVMDGSWYQAAAEDEDGNEYRVVWQIQNPDAEDESEACDWDNPYYVERGGKNVTESVALV